MKHHYIITLLFCLCVVPATLLAQPRIKVACIGNSITENTAVATDDKYPAVLERDLGADKYEVRNYGHGGRTLLKKGDTPYWNSEKYQAAKTWQPDIVVIKLGTNDTKSHNWIYKAEFESDYIEFINSFKVLDSHPQIFLCYPIPLFPPNNWLAHDSLLTNQMMPMIKYVAETTGLTLIDLHTPFEGKNYLVYDQVHPNAKGTTYMAYLIGKVICPECDIPDLPEDLFIQLSTFDFTDKNSHFSSSAEAIELAPLIDNDASTGIDVPFEEGTSFTLELANDLKSTAYSLTTGESDENNTPKSWVLSGSNDGENWVDLDRQTNIRFLSHETRFFTFTFANINVLTGYTYFRLLINENNGGDNLSINEWQMFGFDNDNENAITRNGGKITGNNAGMANESVDKLSDGRMDTKYCVINGSMPWRINYASKTAAKVTKYTLTSANDASERDPMAWKLFGSTNNKTWTLLDEQTNQQFVTRFCTMEYEVNSEEAYSYFRLEISKAYSGNNFQLAEWQLFGEEPTALTQLKSADYQLFSEKNTIYLQSYSDEIISCEIVDLCGLPVFKEKIPSGNSLSKNLPHGIYLVAVSSSSEKTIQKIIL
jgi:lysophospholipase L1-like esterase